MNEDINARRRKARHEKISSNPTMCVICFKRPRWIDKQMCEPCVEAASKHYQKHKAYYASKRKEDSLASPKRNIARMVTFAKSRAGGDIVTDDIFALWVKNDGCCALSGIKMTWGGGKISPNTLSLDRIDPHRGYFKDNVRLVCHAVNCFRQQMSDEQLLMYAKAIVVNMESQISAEKALKEAFV